MEKTHKGGTKTFKEESYAEQAKSINGDIRQLEREIKAHIRRAKEEERPNPKVMRIKNILDMVGRILEYDESTKPPVKKRNAEVDLTLLD